MATSAPSSTNVGSGGRSPRAAPNRPTGNGTLRQRRVGGGSSSSGSAAARPARQTSSGMWKFYTDDSPGIKVGPVPVLVMSLVFIASVFMLHIWGKYTRA